jgi:hypothetical protein
MANANNKNVTTLDDAPAQATAAAPAATAAAKELIKHNAELSGKRKILTIHKGEQGSQSFVFIGLNGVGYQVPRGMPWNVPAELVENLKDAEQTFYERNDKGELVETSSPRFAYSTQDAPDATAAAAA